MTGGDGSSAAVTAIAGNDTPVGAVARNDTPVDATDNVTAQPPRRARTSGAPLDETSKRLVEALQRDGRRSYAALAQDVGLSEAAVRQRIRRLLDDGVMQIVAVTDPMTIGFSRQAMVGIKAEGDLRAVAERLSKLPELEYVVLCAGSFDLLVELVCEDDEHLLRLLDESIRSIEGVRETETFVYLRLVKQTYAWGTR
jgi:Lrp/AsnC family transcriptional regulator for asnA, asnC and gidA